MGQALTENPGVDGSTPPLGAVMLAGWGEYAITGADGLMAPGGPDGPRRWPLLDRTVTLDAVQGRGDRRWRGIGKRDTGPPNGRARYVGKDVGSYCV